MSADFLTAMRLLPLLFALLAWSCPLLAEEDERFPPYDNTPEVEAYFKSLPEFFQFKTPADLPPDLKWDDGMQWPEFSDPAAQKGGALHFPRRSLG
jgi:microcin C transport system substrate-binding protein